MNKGQRVMELDRGRIEIEERQLKEEIEKAARQGNKQACTVLAKQLASLREKKARSFCVGAKLSAVGNKQERIGSSMKMATAIGNTSKTMQKMDDITDPLTATNQELKKAVTKMEMSEDMINDALEEILLEYGEDTNQVLDEIGISGKVYLVTIF